MVCMPIDDELMMMMIPRTGRNRYLYSFRRARLRSRAERPGFQGFKSQNTMIKY